MDALSPPTVYHPKEKSKCVPGLSLDLPGSRSGRLITLAQLVWASRPSVRITGFDGVLSTWTFTVALIWGPLSVILQKYFPNSWFAVPNQVALIFFCSFVIGCLLSMWFANWKRSQHSSVLGPARSSPSKPPSPRTEMPAILETGSTCHTSEAHVTFGIVSIQRGNRYWIYQYSNSKLRDAELN